MINSKDFKVKFNSYELNFNQMKALGAFEGNSNVIINKYRGFGSSTLISNYSVSKALEGNEYIGIFAPNKVNINLIKEVIKFALTYSGNEFLIIEHKYGYEIMLDVLDSKIFIYNCRNVSNDDIIGRKYTKVFIDWFNGLTNFNVELLSILITQSISNDNLFCILSNADAKNSLYHNLFTMSLKGKNSFKLLDLKWFNDDRFNKNLVTTYNDGAYKFESDYSKELLIHKNKDTYLKEFESVF